MICRNCGNNFEGNFCPNCGLKSSNSSSSIQESSFSSKKSKSKNKFHSQSSFYPYDNQHEQINKNTTSSDNHKNSKKHVYKKFGFCVIIFIILCLSISLGDFIDNRTTFNPNQTGFLYEENITTEETTTTTPPLPKEEYKKQCSTISFDTLARNPDKYKGNKYKFIGKVIQVSESTSSGYTYCDLRINLTPNDYNWEDTIFATVTISVDADRILVDDIITIWGECKGNYTYESVLGNSISLPRIDIEYFTIN